MTYKMYDDANAGLLAGTTADAYGGYVDGFVTFPFLLSHYAGKHLLSISIHGNAADCLDIESGAASVSIAPSWYRLAAKRKLHTPKPVLYCSAGQSSTVIGTMSRAGIARGSYLLWSAHYGHYHICGPATCGFPGANGTQFTDKALGRVLDESVLGPEFFAAAKPAPKPKPQPRPLPVLHKGDRGLWVNTLQGALNKHKNLGRALALDGNFGSLTEAHVITFQHDNGLSVDGIVGNNTWAKLGVK